MSPKRLRKQPINSEEGATATVSYADALDKLKGFVPLSARRWRNSKTTELNAAAWSALIAAGKR